MELCKGCAKEEKLSIQGVRFVYQKMPNLAGPKLASWYRPRLATQSLQGLCKGLCEGSCTLN